MQFDRRHYTILAIMTTEVLGFSLVLPFLPLFAKQLGGNPFEIGLIIASFSFFQFLSAPIMGRLSDYIGRRPMLIISQLSTFVSFVILGFANSLWIIILSRVIDGLFGSNKTIAHAYLSDISSKKDRSKAFGLAGMAFGAGFLVGPATGGFLSRFGYALPSFLAAALSLVTILMTFFLLPETIEKRKIGRLKVNILGWSSFGKYFKNKKTSIILLTFAAYVSAFFIFATNQALFLNMRFNFTAAKVGYLLAYLGVINLVFRGPLLGKLIDKIGERRLSIFGVASMASGLLFITFASNNILFYTAYTFFALGSALVRPLITGEVSRMVSQKEQGSILGVTGSLESLSRIVTPILGGFLISNFFTGSLPLTASVIMMLCLVSFFVATVRSRDFLP